MAMAIDAYGDGDIDDDGGTNHHNDNDATFDHIDDDVDATYDQPHTGIAPLTTTRKAVATVWRPRDVQWQRPGQQ